MSKPNTSHCWFQQPHGWQRGLCGALALALALTTVPTPSGWAAPTTSTPRSGSRAPSLNLADLDLDTLHVPEPLGWVTETWQPPGQAPDALVIHLQDLHAHPDAQTRLSELIGYLQDTLGITLVAVEGAEGLCDTTIYSDWV